MTSSNDMLPALSTRAQSRYKIISRPSEWDPVDKYYDAERNPNGPINLSTAENSLMSAELLDYIHSHFRLAPTHLKYRTALSKSYVDTAIDALPRYINEYAKPIIPVTPRTCVPGPGLGSLMPNFFWTVCNDGEGVLLTTPYYTDYPRDITYPGCAVVVPAYVPVNVDSLSTDCLEYISDAITKSNAAGTRVRVLLLCNPHNPLARAYPVDTILGYARLAEEHDLHLLVDEVYANSVFSSKLVPNPTPFVSVLHLDVQKLANCNPARIHVIAGPTKDFGASGIKLGAFVSQHNPAMIEMMEQSLSAFPLSSAADAIFTPILNDDKFRPWFLEENRKRLGEAFEVAAGWCDFHGIPYEPSSAGVFFVVDFAQFVERFDGPVDQRMVDLTRQIQNHGVIMRSTFGSEDPIRTRFRVVFTVPKPTFLLALSRLEKALNLKPWKESSPKL